MSAGEPVGGYVLLQPFTTAGGGQSRWTFARRGGREFFLKEFLAPTYPESDAPGSAAVKARKLQRCLQFEAHHRRVMAALAPLSAAGGNLVVTEEFFRVRSRYYKVTAKVDAASVDAAVIAGLPIETRVGVLLSVTHSLRVLHRAGLVHGDVKPGNILLMRSGGVLTAKLIDFDNCFLVGQPPPSEEMVGDVTYYSPELMLYVLGVGDGGALEQRSDVFALGLVFAWYLTSRLPVGGGAGPRYAADVVREGGRLRVDGGGLPAGLAGLVEQMLSGVAGDRPSADVVYRTLKHLQRSRSAPADEAAARPAVTADASRLRGRMRRPATDGERPPDRPTTAPGSRLRGSLVKKDGK